MATFNGAEGEMINPETAKRWVENYQRREPAGVKAEYFGGDKIKELLSQEGCVGLRIYYANDDYEGWRMILVGVDKDGRNLGPIAGDGKGMLLDGGLPCPPFCPPKE